MSCRARTGCWPIACLGVRDVRAFIKKGILFPRPSRAEPSRAEPRAYNHARWYSRAGHCATATAAATATATAAAPNGRARHDHRAQAGGRCGVRDAQGSHGRWRADLRHATTVQVDTAMVAAAEYFGAPSSGAPAGPARRFPRRLQPPGRQWQSSGHCHRVSRVAERGKDPGSRRH